MAPYKNRKIRFGIVGCGAIGPTHAGAIQQMPDAELIAVADVISDRAQAIADKFSVPKIYHDQAQLLADPAIDVVCLCTPSGLHGDGAVSAMQAGKHVIVEKPMEISTAACDRMIAAQQASGKLLTIISQHRFDSDSIRLKDLITAGKLGKIILATAEVKWWRTQKYYDEGDWRGTWKLDGGGCVMNQGIHTLDLLQWFVGDVDSIFAHTRTAAHERIEVEDVAVATITFKNGAIGSFVASTAVYEGQPVRIEISGTEGSAILEGDRMKEIKLKSGETYETDSAAQHAVRVAQGGTLSVADDAATRITGTQDGAVWGDAHRAQFEDFVRALRTGSKPLIDGPAGRVPVQIVQGLYESARLGASIKLSS